MAAAGIIATAIYKVLKRHCVMLLAGLAPFAMLIAASRVVLDLHYPSDVLAGRCSAR